MSQQNAYFLILKELVEKIDLNRLKVLNILPKNLDVDGQPHLMDALILRHSASGAQGVLWINFSHFTEVVTFPFFLARHAQGADIVSIAPWSLRSAYNDNSFYRSFLHEISKKDYLMTEQGGIFKFTSFPSEPNTLTLGLWEDEAHSWVRVESTESYKFYRVLYGNRNPEMEIMEYLTLHSDFRNFSPLTASFTYQTASGASWLVGVGTHYIYHTGNLWYKFTSLLETVLFPRPLLETRTHDNWNRIVKTASQVGRIIGELHRALTFAKGNPELTPEPCRSYEEKMKYINYLQQGILISIKNIRALAKEEKDYQDVLGSLRSTAHRILAEVKDSDELGVRIRVHGDCHLGQIVYQKEKLFLVDFSFSQHRSIHDVELKQSCLSDLVCALLSIRFLWDKVKGDSSLSTPQSIPFFLKWEEKPRLETLEEALVKSYRNAIFDSPNSAELLPRHPGTVHALFELLFFLRTLQETEQDLQDKNPRAKVGLKVLRSLCNQEFVSYF